MGLTKVGRPLIKKGVFFMRGPAHLSETQNRTHHKLGIVLLSQIFHTPSELNPQLKPFVSPSHQLMSDKFYSWSH